MTHICVSKLSILGSDNGLSPGRRQSIIWTNAGILLIAPWGTNFSEILIGIHTFSFKKIHLKMSSAKWRPFWLGLNVLTHCGLVELTRMLLNISSGNGLSFTSTKFYLHHPDSKFHGANMGPTWGRQDPGGPQVGHMKIAIWALLIYCQLVPWVQTSMKLKTKYKYFLSRICEYFCKMAAIYVQASMC